MPLPEGCELAVRGQYAFVLNDLKTPAELHLDQPMRDLLSGNTLRGDIWLDGHGTLSAGNGQAVK